MIKTHSLASHAGLLLLSYFGILFFSSCSSSGTNTSGNDALYVVPNGVETRWASAENPKGEKGKGAESNNGRKGSPCITDIKNGSQVVLAEASGTSGIIHRIWITIDDRSPQMVRGLRIDMYWDGASEPAVSAPIGDFFSQGLGTMVTFQSALFSNPEGRSFNCYIPMPFRTGMKIVVTNESGKDLGLLFYDVDYTIGDQLPDNVLYFHAWYHRENPTTIQQDFEILPKVEGRGRYLGCNIGVIANQKLYYKSWWGEGEVKMFIDGDQEFPTLSGTGTEDYIGTGWGEGAFANLYQGCIVADGDHFRYCFYRLHVPDPVYFHQSARVTIQQIGYWGNGYKPEGLDTTQQLFKAGPGHQPFEYGKDYGLFERADDWSSCAWFYLDKPTSGLPPIESADKRMEGV